MKRLLVIIAAALMLNGCILPPPNQGPGPQGRPQPAPQAGPQAAPAPQPGPCTPGRPC